MNKVTSCLNSSILINSELHIVGLQFYITSGSFVELLKLAIRSSPI